MGRLLLLVAVALCTYFEVADPAWSQKRVALVIGNGAYETVANLPNPPRDANAISNLLKAAGFDEVTVRTDLGLGQMRAEFRDFARRAVDADIAAVFYAGHGIEVGGHNYIVPIDAKLEFDTDAEDEALGLDHILQQLEPVKRLKLVILDACRENPFAPRMKSLSRTRDIRRGLVPPERPSANTLIAYAAALGARAADGDGVNSPFTTALLRNLTRPGLDVRLALGQTHDDVLAATDNKQEPYIYTSLGGETLALVPSLTTPVAPGPASPATKIEQSAFEAAMRADTIPMLEAFLIQYPQSSSADIARRERDRLKSTNALLTPATGISPAAPAPAPAPTPARAPSPMTKPVPSRPITTNTVVPIVPKPRPVHIATRPRVVQLAPRAKYDASDSSRPTRSKCVNIAGASFCE
jgi:Caspase domain